MCGEYGDNSKRPHYHAIIFGHSFNDSYYKFVDTPSRGEFGLPGRVSEYHPSRILEDCWPFGHVQCGRLNDNRIMYVAGYVLKPGLDDDMDFHDSVALEHATGFKSRNYVRWSRRPGIGGNWIDRFASSVYRYDGKDFEHGDLDRVVSAVVWNRKLVPFACRYFDDRLALQDPAKYDKLKAFRSYVGCLPETKLAHSVALRERELVGLRNRLEVLAKKVANRKRDVT